MDSKSAHDVTPDTPPDDSVPPRAQTPDARTLPHTPPFSPTQQRPKQQPQKTPDPIIQRLESVIDRGLGFELSPTQLDDLERGLQDEKPSLWCFWVHRLCYDYQASTSGGKFVLRMPSAVHEDLIGFLESTIEKELASLAHQLSTKDETTAAEIRRIRKSGSTALQYTEPELDGSDQKATREPVIVRHSPDASFKHPIAGSQAPGLVVEVSYSQRSKKLSRSAESYIINSEHKIRCVVAIDITYIPPEHKESHKDKTATVQAPKEASFCEESNILEAQTDESLSVCDNDLEYLIQEEAEQIIARFMEIPRSHDRLVFWTGVSREWIQQWADEHGMLPRWTRKALKATTKSLGSNCVSSTVYAAPKQANVNAVLEASVRTTSGPQSTEQSDCGKQPRDSPNAQGHSRLQSHQPQGKRRPQIQQTTSDKKQPQTQQTSTKKQQSKTQQPAISKNEQLQKQPPQRRKQQPQSQQTSSRDKKPQTQSLLSKNKKPQTQQSSSKKHKQRSQNQQPQSREPQPQNSRQPQQGKQPQNSKQLMVRVGA
ncbi:hypothetical protein MBLNU13_g08913t1 [Cladosporium sp. NU13]